MTLDMSVIATHAHLMLMHAIQLQGGGARHQHGSRKAWLHARPQSAHFTSRPCECAVQRAPGYYMCSACSYDNMYYSTSLLRCVQQCAVQAVAECSTLQSLP